MTTVICPDCGSQIDVQDALLHQAEEKSKAEYEKKLKDYIERTKSKEEAILKKEKEINDKNSKLERELEERLKVKELEFQKIVEEKLKSQYGNALKELEEQAMQQKKELSEFEVLKVKLSQAEAQKSLEVLQAKSSLNEEFQKRLTEHDKEARTKLELAKKEFQIKLDEQRKLTETMLKKQDQGSMQMQGEALELIVEEYLKGQFALDTISEIKKGVRGADVLQTVNTRTSQGCGKILYESKRASNWNNEWVQKLKSDALEAKADIAVLVTTVYPSGVNRLSNIDGVWVCSYEEFKGLAAVLRDGVLRVSSIALTQVNKGSKMEVLYDYMTSESFKQSIISIVENFTHMSNDLQKEKTAMSKIWSQREQRLQEVLNKTAGLFGTIKSIGGDSIKEIPQLEL